MISIAEASDTRRLLLSFAQRHSHLAHALSRRDDRLCGSGRVGRRAAGPAGKPPLPAAEGAASSLGLGAILRRYLDREFALISWVHRVGASVEATARTAFAVARLPCFLLLSVDGVFARMQAQDAFSWGYLYRRRHSQGGAWQAMGRCCGCNMVVFIDLGSLLSDAMLDTLVTHLKQATSRSLDLRTEGSWILVQLRRSRLWRRQTARRTRDSTAKWMWACVNHCK